MDQYSHSNRLQYWQGWGAFHAGAMHTMNPYSSHIEPEHYKQWNHGWHDAALEVETS